MKKRIHTDARRRFPFVRPLFTLGIGFLLALFSAALTYSTPPAMEGTFVSGVFLSGPASSPSQQADRSEIGSTDGIVIMGFVIALIIVVPILLRRKEWMEPR